MKKMFLEKRLIMVDGGAGQAPEQGLPNPDQQAVLQQGQALPPLQQPPQQLAAQPQQQIQPSPAPEAAPQMPQMGQNPEAMKPVTTEDINKAGDAILQKGITRGAANSRIMDSYAAIKIEPLSFKA